MGYENWDRPVVRSYDPSNAAIGIIAQGIQAGIDAMKDAHGTFEGFFDDEDDDS